MKADLIFLRDLESAKSESRNTSWAPAGPHPAFTIETDQDSLRSGWAVVSIDIEIDDPLMKSRGFDSPVTVRFLPETGDVQLTRHSIPNIAGRRTRVLYVPEGTARLEVVVSPWIENVTASSLSLRPLNHVAAAAAMVSDLAASSVRGSTDGASLVDQLRNTQKDKGTRHALSEIASAYEKLQRRRAGDDVDYLTWRIHNATMFERDRPHLEAAIDQLPGGGPSVSVLMPVYNPDPALLSEAIESVRDQVYARWELIIVDDASTDERIRTVLDAAAAQDSRIRVRHRSKNGHIVATTNDAAELATGEFVAFMDHDDLLAPFALAVVALAATGADILYTDEDKVDIDGNHYDPHLKPTWNPELLLGQNYLSHLTVMRRSVFEQAGGLRVGYEGSQDHDLLLRATALVPDDRIKHVPFVAYHWRAVTGSTALSPGAKSYTEDASVRALEDRLGPTWTVELAGAPTAYRVIPPLEDFPLVSILIPTRDRLSLVENCIDSLARTTYPAFEVIVIDNDSADPQTRAWMDEFDNGRDRRVIQAPGDFNFSRINNVGARSARGELLLLLNNDTEVIDPAWLTNMVRWIQQPDVGIVGAKLLYPNDTIQHAGVILGLGGFAGHGHLHEAADSTGYFNRLAITHEAGAVTGACLLTRAQDWHELGGLDEELAVAFNDIDYCLKVRHQLGRRVLWCADATLYHHESVSRGAEDDPVKVARFNSEVDLAKARWSKKLRDDPAYSPNLTLSRDSFTLARQPRVVAPWTPGATD